MEFIVSRANKPITNSVIVNLDCKIIKIKNLYYQCRYDNTLEKNIILLNKVQRDELKVEPGDKINITISDISSFNMNNIVEFDVSLYEMVNSSITIDSKVFIDHFLNHFYKDIIFWGRQYIFEHDNQHFILLKKYDSTSITEINEDTHINISTSKNIKLLQNFNFTKKNIQELGVGGLQKEYEEILRRIFNSRLVDKNLFETLGLKHVKGIIMYGPPGTGKTLLSKQFSQLIGDVQPIVVNGPEIKNKYVGQSEENIRKLFKPAIDNPEKISVIIFDEIDAICKERGMDNSGVNDGIVNQLLSLMDGVNQLNNILIIGITNRLELLDSALLRPGRFEVHLRISLPNIKGRCEIFNIYLKPFYDNKKLQISKNYDEYLYHVSKLTHNYSGAEISGIIKSATSYSLNRQVDWDIKEKKIIKDIVLTEDDISLALQEIKPQWSGKHGDLPSRWEEYIIDDKDITNILSMLKNGKKILIVGAVKSGKTQYLVELSSKIEMDKYVIYINENIQKALNSISTVKPDYIFLDDILDLVGFVSLGCRYQTDLVLKLKELTKQDIPMVATCTDENVLESLGLYERFDETIFL